MKRVRQKDILMPPSWTAEKKRKFIAWLNDELTADEGRELLRLNKEQGQ